MEPQTGNGSQRNDPARSPTGTQAASGTPPTGAGQGAPGRAGAGGGAPGGERALSQRRGSRGELGDFGSPFNTMMQLSREMDRLWDSFFGRSFGGPSRLMGAWPFEGGGGTGAGTSGRMGGAPTLWSPHVDVRHKGDAILVHADLPGVRKEDVRIEATEDGIAISGERQQQREEGDRDQGYRFSERSHGSFYRSIPLPEGAQVEQARARMSEGVLEVTIPVQQPQRRQIRIE